MKVLCEIVSFVSLVFALVYLNQETPDAAHVAFWMGLAVFNQITAVSIWLREKMG